MFPRSLLIFILIIVLDIITKSVKDKRKIERSKRRREERMNKPSNSPKTIKSSLDNNETIIEENIYDRIDEVFKDKELYRVEVETEKVNDSKETQDLKSDINRVKNLSKSKKRVSNEILKGVIYSEILSEPKSIKNMRKSI